MEASYDVRVHPAPTALAARVVESASEIGTHRPRQRCQRLRQLTMTASSRSPTSISSTPSAGILDGDGTPTDDPDTADKREDHFYRLTFPNAAIGHGLPDQRRLHRLRADRRPGLRRPNASGGANSAADSTYWNSGNVWEPINRFTGTFEGNDNTIANLFIDRDRSRPAGAVRQARRRYRQSPAVGRDRPQPLTHRRQRHGR